jgi:undecaprenyl-diphosphatase
VNNVLQPIFLGVLQGLTEFLPISSSAHLRIAGEFFNTPVDPGATFTAITQIGTELAVLIYFRKDIGRIISAVLRFLIQRKVENEAKLGWFIALGSLPVFVLGFIGQDTIRSTFRSLWLIASVLIIFGLILGYTDKIGKSTKTIESLKPRDAILYGFAQSLALIPGVSRSGATIAMGRLLGYERVAALRYSFLLALPAVFGSGLFELYKALTDPSTPSTYSMPMTLLATVIAFFVGYAMIAWLLKFVATKSFAPFVIYRVLLGTLVIALLSSGIISA